MPFVIRHLGWFVAAALAATWYYFPAATVWLLDSNLWLLSVLGKGIAAVVPAEWGGALLMSLTGLVGKIANGVNWLTSSAPQAEASIKILLEGLLILGEVKVIRGLLAIPYGLRKAKNWLRGPAKVVDIRGRAVS